jgi:hypothetical protein
VRKNQTFSNIQIDRIYRNHWIILTKKQTVQSYYYHNYKTEIKSSVSHIYRNHCDGKHLNIGRNPLAKDERFYPWMMKEDTAAEHLD